MTAHPGRWLTAAMVMAAVPLLWGSGAQAQPASGGQAVVFTGGCADRTDSPPGVTAEPSALTVPPGAEIAFVNHLGRRATLLLDGEPAVTLPAGGRAGVTFHGGPVEATLEITCPRGDLAAAVPVSVTDRPADSGTNPGLTLSPTPTPTSAPSPGDAPAGDNPVEDDPALVAGAGSGGSGGPNGVLTLVATVCVAGVTAAAIRVMLARRARQPELA